MKINKAMLAAGVVTTVAAGSLLGVGAVSAQSSDNGQTGLIDKLVAKFNLNSDEVEAVFDEVRDEKQAEMDEKRSEQLQTLVDEGKLTAEQKSALEAKFEEQQAQREANRNEDLTNEERREQMKADRDEFKAWAEEQGIDLELIRPDKGQEPRGHHGPRGGMNGGETEE